MQPPSCHRTRPSTLLSAPSRGEVSRSDVSSPPRAARAAHPYGAAIGFGLLSRVPLQKRSACSAYALRLARCANGMLRASHIGKRKSRSWLSLDRSGAASLAKRVHSGIGWSTRTASARRSSSHNRGSITVSTSVAIDNRNLLSSRASGTTAAAISVASQSSPMTGVNALADCLIRFLIASIWSKARSRSRRFFSSERRVSISAI